MFAVAGSDQADLGIAMFVIATNAYKTLVMSWFNPQLQCLEPVAQGAGGADMATSKSRDAANAAEPGSFITTTFRLSVFI